MVDELYGDAFTSDFERTQMFLNSLRIKYEIVPVVNGGLTIEADMGYSGQRGVFPLKLVFSFDDNGKFTEWRLCEY